MSGISDSVGRRLARSFGADITISELISAEGLVRGCERTWELACFHNSERPIGLQIFGARPNVMALAASKLSRLNPDFIDLNFGCPARKIVGKNGGSSILRDLDLLGEIVSAVVKSVEIPVTAKMRSGWNSDELTYIQAGGIIEQAGAAAVTIHPRTREQGFSGRADWSVIKRLKEKVNIPVIGNGDIVDPQDARKMYDDTGCDAVMVGRGSICNPWIFKRIKYHLETGLIPPEPSCRERIDVALIHFEMAIEHYGLPRAVFMMRGQFCRYLRGLRGNAEIRAEINRLLDPSEIKALLTKYGDGLESEN
jgi:tRNA-dihydrouridine synthase B